jgi:hypothetical protein
MDNANLPVDAGAYTATSISMVFNGQMLGQLTAFANLMADSTITVPAHLTGKPADCMAVIMQAMQWGMNPYAVAQKTYLVGGALGYEAQLVNAVITSSNAVQGRFHYEYGGDWSKCTRSKEITETKTGKNGTYEVTRRVGAWSEKDEDGLFIRVGAVIRGEKEIAWGEPVYLSSVAIRNSPLWVTNPKQQIAYLAVKYWSRLHTPAVTLGVYTPDELERRVEREINPSQPPTRVSVSQLTDQPVAPQRQDSAPLVDGEGIAAEIRAAIENVKDLEPAKALRKQVEDLKQKLGITDYTELKNKAVRRYRQIEKATDINSQITACKTPEAFAALEALVRRSERDLSTDDLERFQITLDDMRPEFKE